MAAANGAILIIDDDAALNRTLSLMLSRAGYDVSTAAGGRKGLERLAAGGIDLVLTDIIMPELDGIEAIRRIRDEHPELRVIAMSGGGQIDKADFLHMAEALGADGVMEKPVRQEQLLKLVGTVMAAPPRKMLGRS